MERLFSDKKLSKHTHTHKMRKITLLVFCSLGNVWYKQQLFVIMLFEGLIPPLPCLQMKGKEAIINKL